MPASPLPLPANLTHDNVLYQSWVAAMRGDRKARAECQCGQLIDRIVAGTPDGRQGQGQKWPREQSTKYHHPSR